MISISNYLKLRKKKKKIKNCDHEFQVANRHIETYYIHHLSDTPRTKLVVTLYCPKCDFAAEVDEVKSKTVLKQQEIRNEYLMDLADSN